MGDTMSEPTVIHLYYADGATAAAVDTPAGRVVALGRDETDAVGWLVRRHGEVLGLVMRWELEEADEAEAGAPEF
jgi:hypothetical protein